MMLEGKVAVISGGTRGIGNAIAWKFAEQGANLALIATRDSERNKKAVKELSETGRDVRLYICDVKDPEQVVSVAEEILADFGTVDVLVNNAGITRDNLLPSLSVMDIDDVIDVNLKGTIYLTRAFVRSFVKQRHGNIVNISSVVGLMGNPHAVGEAFQITSDETLTWNQIYEEIAKALGVPLHPYHVASDFLSDVGKDYDFEGSLTGDKSVSVVFDNSKLKRTVLDFKPTVTFAQGVRIALDNILAHPELQREDAEFDEWCDKVIDVLEKAKNNF